MSLDAARLAWIQQNVSSTQKIVLPSPADRASEDCRCRPSPARLGHDTCLNKKTAIACISDFIENGSCSAVSDAGLHLRLLFFDY